MVGHQVEAHFTTNIEPFPRVWCVQKAVFDVRQGFAQNVPRATGLHEATFRIKALRSRRDAELLIQLPEIVDTSVPEPWRRIRVFVLEPFLKRHTLGFMIKLPEVDESLIWATE